MLQQLARCDSFSKATLLFEASPDREQRLPLDLGMLLTFFPLERLKHSVSFSLVEDELSDDVLLEELRERRFRLPILICFHKVHFFHNNN
ncbi:hypothetical protein NQ314_017437 [Rhamnusium bicolor]|uniref:Uncharacterized protein n=1 Tax=Rhamnusium bicolor TaxID=1586634 RepID=A0AAV8WTD8_9CUCU|nr:hypothetical protein NQ314_017437 [Rhamnusium bicolor]